MRLSGWLLFPCRIYDICYNSTRLRDVIVGDLLPSSAMIRDLSQEFGIPITQEGFSEEALLATPPQPSPNLEHFRSRTSTLSTEIHAHQRKYLQWRNAVLLQKEGHKLSLIQVGLSLLGTGAPGPSLPCTHTQGKCFTNSSSWVSHFGTSRVSHSSPSASIVTLDRRYQLSWLLGFCSFP